MGSLGRVGLGGLIRGRHIKQWYQWKGGGGVRWVILSNMVSMVGWGGGGEEE